MLFNETLYNENVYWQLLEGISQVDDDIVFNNFWLQNANICISNANFDSLANIEINAFSTPQDDGGGILSRYFRDKIINFTWRVKWETEQDLINYVDLLKQWLSEVEGNLDIKFAGNVRRIKATLQSLTIPREHYNINVLPFSISFLCKEPFFYDKTAIETSFLWKTTTFQDEIINEWYVEVPLTTRITFTSATSVENISLIYGGWEIEVNETIAMNDVLEINGETKKVYLNGVEVDYDGVFWKLWLNKNTIIFTIDWTFNVDISCFYNKTYR